MTTTSKDLALLRYYLKGVRLLAAKLDRELGVVYDAMNDDLDFAEQNDELQETLAQAEGVIAAVGL